jgi:sortase (surface protein transpeptidase)
VTGSPRVLAEGPRRDPVPARPWTRLSALGVGLAALLLLSLVGYLVLVSPLEQARYQKVLYDGFRPLLGDSTAPVSALTADGEPVRPGDPVALLRIPSLGVDEVVVFGTTSSQLKRGPGLRRDAAFPGTVGSTVLLGRQSAYGGPFGAVETLAPGSPVLLTTGSGEWRYEVTGLRRAGSAREVVAPGTAVLTLVTTTGPPLLPRAVVYVDARLVGEPGPAVARGAALGSLPASEDVMGSDPSGMPNLLLWCLVILAASLGLTWAAMRWGPRQAWVVGVPLLAALLVGLHTSVAAVLPNLM